MNLRLIILTTPDFLPQEATALTAILDKGFRLHLRKPGCNEKELAALIEELPASHRAGIVLHDHFILQQRYGLAGIHLNKRNPDIPSGYNGSISRSCHSLEEITEYKKQTDYLFLSPIFNSISKQGYRSEFSMEQIRTAAHKGIIDTKIIALGGITADNLTTVRTLGFGGAALLGDVWNRYRSPDDTEAFLQHLDKLIQTVS